MNFRKGKTLRATSLGAGSFILVLVPILVFSATAVLGDNILEGNSHAGDGTKKVTRLPASNAGGLKLRVYIYEDEVLNWKTLLPRCLAGSWQDSHIAQYGSGLAILEGLLEHPQRTPEPEEADLFFVPLSVTISKLCPDNDHVKRMSAAERILKKSKWFRRLDGADHFVVDGHWNLNFWRPFRILRQINLGFTEDRHPKLSAYCTFEVPFPESVFAKSLRKPPTEPRNHLVAYLGKTDVNDKVCMQARKAINSIKASDVVNGNVGRSWEGIGTKQGVTSSFSDVRKNMLTFMSDSIFCFVPCGDKPMYSSNRLFDAIAAGCLPIFIADRYLGTFSDLVPWNQFSLRISEHGFSPRSAAGLVAKLRAMPNSTITKMQQRLEHYRKDLLLLENGGTRAISNVLTQAARCREMRA